MIHRTPAIGLLLVLAWSSSAGADALLVAADTAIRVNDVRSKLVATGRIAGNIDVFDATLGTPAAALLSGYDGVMVWSNGSFADRGTLGDRLADYVDGGGGVVVATFAVSAPTSGFSIGGRFQSDGYSPLTFVDFATGGDLTLGTVSRPGHTLMGGVGSFDGGSSSFRQTGAPIGGAELIAAWSNGDPLAVTSELEAGPIALLNFYPVSSDVQAGLWDAATDGDRLMANALNYVSGVPEPTTALLLTLGVAVVFPRRPNRRAGR